MEVKRKNLLFIMCVSLVIVLIIVALLVGIGYRVNRKAISEQMNPKKPVVALTFDDGPNSRFTPQMLDILYENQVPVTFFLVGEKLKGNELIVREMAASGHEIGNHTFSHPDLTTLDREQIQLEIRQTEIELKKILPGYQLKYVRPPYGRYSEKVENTVDNPLILWTVDSGDWKDPNEKKIYTAVVEKIQDGDIIVFHDDNAQTVAAVENVISELRERDFQFVTISQLYEMKKEK